MPSPQLADSIPSDLAPPPGCVSPLVLADRLLSLAQDADRAGLARPAARLVRLAYAICGEKPSTH